MTKTPQNNYIYLPVIIGGMVGHITLKYLGDINVPVEHVKSILSQFVRFTPSVHEWNYETWTTIPVCGVTEASASDESVQLVRHHVLKITEADSLLWSLNKALEPLCPPQYRPWKPHITFRFGEWDYFRVNNVQPYNTEVLIGTPHYKYLGMHINLMDGVARRSVPSESVLT